MGHPFLFDVKKTLVRVVIPSVRVIYWGVHVIKLSYAGYLDKFTA